MINRFRKYLELLDVRLRHMFEKQAPFDEYALALKRAVFRTAQGGNIKGRYHKEKHCPYDQQKKCSGYACKISGKNSKDQEKCVNDYYFYPQAVLKKRRDDISGSHYGFPYRQMICYYYVLFCLRIIINFIYYRNYPEFNRNCNNIEID